MIRLLEKTAIIICMINLIFIPGCATVLNSRIEKGSLVKEEPTGRGTIEIERKPQLELLTPTSVFVLETVKYGDEYQQFFEKTVEETTVSSNPLRFISFSYCEDTARGLYNKASNWDEICTIRTKQHIIKNEYIRETSFKNVVTKKLESAVFSGYFS